RHVRQGAGAAVGELDAQRELTSIPWPAPAIGIACGTLIMTIWIRGLAGAELHSLRCIRLRLLRHRPCAQAEQPADARDGRGRDLKRGVETRQEWIELRRVGPDLTPPEI